jgi:tetratricopeptide (TPR) repeat protein
MVEKLEVKKWPLAVAVEFLLKRTDKADAAAAEAVARELDTLPLALEQAAAYIDATGATLVGYLAVFQNHQIEMLKRGAPGGEYPATVATTWEVSFQQLEKESPIGAALLRLCAFFAPDDIPRDVIATGARHLPEPLRSALGDDLIFGGLAFNDAVAEIRRYSLIETGTDSTLSMHRLVQAVIRDRLGAAGRKQWAEAAVKVVSGSLPRTSQDVTTWKECARLQAHAITTLDFADRFDVDLGLETIKVGVGLANLGSNLRVLGDLPRAKSAFEHALKIDENVFGNDSPRAASRSNDIGIVLMELSDFSGAKAAFERALAIFRNLGDDHPDTKTVWKNLESLRPRL